MKTRRYVVICLSIFFVEIAAGRLGHRPRADEPGDPQDIETAAVLVRMHSPVLGAPQATVTVVEFFDPSCEACRAFHPFTKQLLVDFAGKVRVWVCGVRRSSPHH